jgi:hypothetical protein
MTGRRRGPSAPGKLLTLALTVTVWGVAVRLEGTVEILDVHVDLAERGST